MNTQTENVENVEVVNELTIEQVNTLKSRGIDETLIQVLSFEQLKELLEKSEKESLVIRVKKQRTNICTVLQKSFENEDVVTFTKAELIEKINLLNYKSFFTITLNGADVELTNTLHAKPFAMLKDYVFKIECKNKQVDACPIQKDKVNQAIKEWLLRGTKIVNSELGSEKSDRFFNKYKELRYTMTVEDEVYTFTKK